MAIIGTKVNGQASIYKYDDYYPYGSVAQSGGSNYRYEYQGAYAEKDSVTGYNNFQLRMYDGRIGRWLGVDPAGQFASPYEGMGNNPVGGSDPTGGDFWHTDSDGNLIADQGDNAATLSDYLQIDYGVAARLFGTNASWDEGTASSGIGADENIAGNYMTANTVITDQYGGTTTVGNQLAIVKAQSQPQATINAAPFGAFTSFFYDLKKNYSVPGRLTFDLINSPVPYLTRLLGIKGESAPYGINIDGTPALRKELTDSGVGVVTAFLPGIGEAGETGITVLGAYETVTGPLGKADKVVNAYMENNVQKK